MSSLVLHTGKNLLTVTKRYKEDLIILYILLNMSNTSIVKPHKFEHFFLEFLHSLNLVFADYKGKKYIEFLDIVNQYPTDTDSDKIIYNTEQLTREIMLYRLSELSKRYTIFDYSSTNLDLLKKMNFYNKSCLLPVLFDRDNMCFNKNTVKEFDVIFLGDLSERRHNIIKQLVAKGLTVYILTSCYDFKLKHEMIMRAKVLINIHANDDYNVFEFARCSVPVFNDCVVVSETSLPERGSFVNDYVLSRVIFEEYDKLVGKVVDVINNYNTYRYSSNYTDLEELTKREITKITSELEYIL
jgi:hypothetical protein